MGQVAIGPIHTSTDIAELAARLGSIVTYDRRGNVAMLDDFEGPVLKWRVPVGIFGSAVLDATNVRSGAQSVKFWTAAGWWEGAMSKQVPLLASKKLGVEFSFCELGVNWYLYAWLFHSSATAFVRAELRIDEGNARIAYYNPAGIYEDLVTGLSIPSTPFYFNTIKFVADFDDQKFMRLMFNEVEYDISDKLLDVGGAHPTDRYCECGFILANIGGGAAGNCWVDDVIITQNEPPNPKP